MVTIRSLEPSDQQALWDWLHLALWDPPPAGLRPREVLDNPAVKIYAEGWGKEGDVGVVCVPRLRPLLMVSALEAAAAAGYRQVSLTVHPQNPAVELYRSVGFEKRDVRNTYLLMVASTFGR